MVESEDKQQVPVLTDSGAVWNFCWKSNLTIPRPLRQHEPRTTFY